MDPIARPGASRRSSHHQRHNLSTASIPADKPGLRQAQMSVIVRPAGVAAGSAVVRLAMGGWPLRRAKSQPAAGQAEPVQVGVELRQPWCV